MYFSISSLLLSSLAASALAAPIDQRDTTDAADTSSSKKNVYLATCSTKGLFSLFDRDSSSVAIYFNGPSSSRSPSDAETVSAPATAWDNATRRVVLSAGTFTSNIAAGASSLSQYAIAGSATLGREDLVCFRDGVTGFTFSSGLLGLKKTDCVADFWCASLKGVGNAAAAGAGTTTTTA